MLKEFVTWWAQQWLDLLPRRLAAANRWSNALLIDVPAERGTGDPIFFAVTRRVNGEEAPVGRFLSNDNGIAGVRGSRRMRGRNLPVLLRLRPGALLEHRLTIPIAAEHDAAQVLRYEIDRVTPFAAEDIVWAWETEHRDRERGRLFVRLSLVPRTLLFGLPEFLSLHGLAAQTVEAVAEDGAIRHLPMQSGADAHAQGRLQHAVIRGLVAACVLLSVAAAAAPIFIQQAYIDRARREIALLQPRVTEAMALRRRIAGQAAGADVIAAAEARTGDVLQALAVVTNVLPDDTFLTEFDISQRHMSLTGQSADPAKLIATMSADSMLTSPSFSAPVTAAPTGKGSLFSISADLVP